MAIAYINHPYLQNNSIDDDAVTALITYLPSVFPCIEDIDLDDNLVSTEGLKRLEEFLQVRLQQFHCTKKIHQVLRKSVLTVGIAVYIL